MQLRRYILQQRIQAFLKDFSCSTLLSFSASLKSEINGSVIGISLIELYNVQGDGAIRLMRHIANVGRTWAHILTGPMADDPDVEGILMYNRRMGQASLFRIDEACTLKRIRDYSGWRRGWTSIIWFEPLFRDLSVSTISSSVDTSARKIQFKAIIHNSGDDDIAGPIEVLIGTSIPNWMYAQDHVDVPEGVTIARNHVYETSYTSQYELYDNIKYLIDVLIDPNYLKGDLWRMNNYFHTEYVRSP